MMSSALSSFGTFYKHGYVRLAKMHFRRIGARQLQTSTVVSTKVGTEEDVVPFKNTKAATWKRMEPLPPIRNVPVYQPFVIGISVIVFLVYFLILREESDIDMEFEGSLFERVPGLEESQLKLAIEYNKKFGKDVADLEKRLREIVVTK